MGKTTYFLLGFISLFFFVYTVIWGLMAMKTNPHTSPTNESYKQENLKTNI